MSTKVITSFVYPPIPIRTMDWQAYFDGDEPNDDGQMRHGSGTTERNAIEDLLALDAEGWKPTYVKSDTCEGWYFSDDRGVMCGPYSTELDCEQFMQEAKGP